MQEGYSHPFRDSSAWARVLELDRQHQAAPATVLQAAADCMVDAKVHGLKLEAVADSVAGKLLTVVLLIKSLMSLELKLEAAATCSKCSKTIAMAHDYCFG